MNKKLFHDVFKGYNIQLYSWMYKEVVVENNKWKREWQREMEEERRKELKIIDFYQQTLFNFSYLLSQFNPAILNNLLLDTSMSMSW